MRQYIIQLLLLAGHVARIATAATLRR